MGLQRVVLGPTIGQRKVWAGRQSKWRHRHCSLKRPMGRAYPDTTKQELLRKGVDYAGLNDVARALAASPELVESWMRGQASMPDGKLLVLAAFLDRLGRPEKA
jgi:hypothetical protein